MTGEETFYILQLTDYGCWQEKVYTMAKITSSNLTKTYLDKALHKAFDTWGRRIESSVTDLARHMTLSFGTQRAYMDGRFDTIDGQFTEVNIKLDAIMESVATRKEMHNLVRELKHQGIQIDASKVFVV